MKRLVRKPVRYGSGYLADAVMARHGSHEPPDRRQVYAALSVLDARYGWRGASLSAAEMRVFSQNGEDGVLAEIFSRIGTTNRFFVEFGVETGVEGNAILLADALSWDGVFYEAAEEHFVHLAAKYANNPRVRTVQGFITAGNVNTLFAQAGVPAEPDLVSIDVDGDDYFIWEGLTDYRPRVVVVEYNSSLPVESRRVTAPDDRGVRVWDGTSYFGCSLGALVAVAQRKGYTLAHCEMTGNNAFFVRAEDWSKLGVDTVTLRSPNHYLTGRGHPPDPHGRAYLDV